MICGVMKTEDFFAGIDEGAQALELDTLEQLPADSQSENNEGNGEPAPQGGESTPEGTPAAVDEENIPFHRHPRWIAMKTKDKEKEHQIEELRGQLKSFEDRFSQMSTAQKENVAQALPQEFVQLFGDNPDAWTAMEKLIANKAQDIVEKRFTAMTEQEKQRQEAQQRAEQIIEKEFESLSEETGLDFTQDSSLRNAVKKIALQYRPLNDAGDAISFTKAYELYTLLNPTNDSTDEKKRIAANASSTVSSSGKKEKTKAVNASQLRKLRIGDFFKT